MKAHIKCTVSMNKVECSYWRTGFWVLLDAYTEGWRDEILYHETNKIFKHEIVIIRTCVYNY